MLNSRKVSGFLLDVTGVLYNTNDKGGVAIQGSIDAVNRLYNESKLKFLSNESSATREEFANKLRRLGFNLKTEDLFTPAPAAVKYIKEHNLRPYLLLHDDVKPEFDGLNMSNPNCIVIGDAEDNFTYRNMNEAFRILHNDPECLLLSLGTNKFYQRTDGPYLDVGAYAHALIYATDCKHVEMGKPSKIYFEEAVNELGCKPEEVVMIGDDIVSDVGGAQKLGMMGIQVRTGKFQKKWENHATVKPDLIADNLLAAVNTVLDYKN